MLAMANLSGQEALLETDVQEQSFQDPVMQKQQPVVELHVWARLQEPLEVLPWL
jgi:hypothetical protein